jgi:hypothetical protein
MAVQAQLGVIREIATELEKERPEIPVDGIDVVVVHHCRRFDDPRVRLAGPRATPLLGAEDGSPFLRLADENNAFFGLEPTQVLGHHVVFALALDEQHDRHPMSGGKAIQFFHKAPAHRAHQRRRCQWLPAVVAEKAHCPIAPLQSRHTDIEVHPVDRFDRQPNMIGEKLGHILCYHPHRLRSCGFALSKGV